MVEAHGIKSHTLVKIKALEQKSQKKRGEKKRKKDSHKLDYERRQNISPQHHEHAVNNTLKALVDSYLQGQTPGTPIFFQLYLT